jgi:acyl-CoA synthetase (AMP-forming)/AMP-acid ligase II
MSSKQTIVHHSPYADVPIPNLSLHEAVLATAAERGDQPALIDGPSGRTITYGQLAEGVRRAAAGLAARGFGKGDAFAIYLPNVPEYAIAFYAVSTAGGVSTTANPLYTADALASQHNDSHARFLLTAPPLLERALAAAERSSVQEVFVLGEAEGATPFAALLASEGDPPAVELDPATDLATLPYSSGTTGLPKGVMLTHRNLVANLCQTDQLLAQGTSDRVIAVLPLYHIYGLTVLMCGAVRKGATLVTMPRFDLEEFLRLIQDHRVTQAFLVPPIILALAKHPLVDKYDLSSLNTVLSGAAPLDAGLEAAAAARIGTLVTQGWGLTETSPVATTNLGGEPRPGSVGRLIPNTLCRVVDPASGADLGVGETGELVLAGPQIMKGYLGRPEETAGMLDEDGWLYTGDLGYIDGDGYLYVVDRVKELIKYKGLQVAPAELEAVLLTHPAIADAAVVRVADEEAGEVPKAFVVARSPLTEAEVMAYVAERVAPFKKVRKVEFVDEIPKAPSGKILRRILAAR